MRFRIFICVLVCSAFLVASVDSDDQKIDLIEYRDIEWDCHRIIYNIHRNLPISEWSDSFTREMIVICVGGLLIDLGTPASRTLYAQYEAMDWKIEEMMEFHYQLDRSKN